MVWFFGPPTLERVIRKAIRRFKPHGLYGLTTSPVFWRDVFIRHHGEAPHGPDDTRWDALFKEGYPILRKRTQALRR